MEDARGWEEAAHPLVQTTEERRDVNGSDGGGEDAAAAAGPEPGVECQSAIVFFAAVIPRVYYWYEYVSFQMTMCS